MARPSSLAPDFVDDTLVTEQSNDISHPLSFSTGEHDVFHSSYQTLSAEPTNKIMNPAATTSFDRGDNVAARTNGETVTISSKTTEIRLNDDDEDTGIFAPYRAGNMLNQQQTAPHQVFVPKLKLARSISDEQADENNNNEAHEQRAQASPPLGSRNAIFDESQRGNNLTDTDKTLTNDRIRPSQLQSLSSLANDPFMQQQMTPDAGGDFLRVIVSEPSKVGEGMQAYIVYKITSETNMPLFQATVFSVVRRFSDFLGLYGKLLEKYAPSGRIVPPAPEKSVFGITKLKVGPATSPTTASIPSLPSSNTSNNDEDEQSEFVAQRRAALERFVNRLAQHPVFRTDPDFREFITLNEALPRATNTSAFSVASSLRLLSRVGENLTKITSNVAGAGRMEEKDPWFEERALEVERMEQSLKRLYSCVEALAHHRRDVSASVGGLSSALALLANSEEHTSLSRAMSQLAESQEDVDLLVQRQSRNDHLLFGELLHDYIGLLGSVQNVFNERYKAFQRWQHAQLQTSKRREQKTRAEWSGKHDKASQLDEELKEWTQKVEKGEQDFENISVSIKREFAVFNKQRLAEMRIMLIKYVREMIQNEKQLIKVWERFGPEAKSITTS